MTQQIFRKLRLLSIAQEEPTKSQAVQRPKEEEQVHAKPMTRQCAGDWRAQGQSDARASVARAGSGHGAHGARGEASGNLSKVPEESRAAGKAREHARRRARARRTQTRAPDGPRRFEKLLDSVMSARECSRLLLPTL